VITIPGFKRPVSTLPTGTVPIPPILYTSYKGSLRGLSLGLLGWSRASKAEMRVGPLYQSMLDEASTMLSPNHPDMGMNGILSGL